MKRMISSCLVVVFLLVLLTLSASAEAFANVKMTPFEGSLKKGDQFSVRFYVSDIVNEYGLALAEFKVHFDKESLKFISSDAGRPAAWNFTNDVAEIWEKLDEKSGDTFIFAALNPINNQGVKTDGEIYLEMKFELLKDISETEFRLTNIHFADDMVVESKLDDKRFVIHFDGTKETNPDIAPAPATSDQTDKSNDPSTSSTESGAQANESTGEPKNNESNNNTLTIVLIVSIVALVVIAAIVVAVIVSRKKKAE